MLSLPGIATTDPQAVMRRLGMPPGAEWARATSRGPVESSGFVLQIQAKLQPDPLPLPAPLGGFAGWEGYHLELFGRTVRNIPSIVTRPYVQLKLAQGLGTYTLEVWYTRVFIPEEGVQVEGIWTPDTRQKAITAAGPNWRGKPLEAAGYAVRLLEEFEQSRADRETRDQARTRIRGGLAKLAAQRYPPKLTRPTLGDALGLTKDGVRELLDRAIWDMTDVKAIYAELLSPHKNTHFSDGDARS